VSNNTERIVALEETAAQQVVTNNFVSESLTSLRSDIQQNSSRISGLSTQLASLNITVEANKTQCDTKYATLADTVNALSVTVGGYNNRINTVELSVISLSNQQTINTDNITLLFSWKDEIESWKASIDERVANIGAIDTALTLISELQTNVNNLSISVSTNTEDIGKLALRVTTLESQYVDMVSKFQILNNSVSQNTSDISIINGNISALITAIGNKADVNVTNQLSLDISNLQSWKIVVDEHMNSSLPSTIMNRIEALEDKQVGNEQNFSNINASLDSIEVSQAEQDTKIQEATEGVTANTSAISNLSTTVSSHVTTNQTEHSSFTTQITNVTNKVGLLEQNDAAIASVLDQHTSDIALLKDTDNTTNERLTTLEQTDITHSEKISALEGLLSGDVIAELRSLISTNAANIQTLNEEVLGAKAVTNEIDSMV
jgi:predicted  nucleic acid-binding Zn-ribbon protein